MLERENREPRQLRRDAERFIVWCRDCRHQVDDDPADQVDRYRAETTVRLARSARLPQCGGQRVDMVVTEPSAMLTPQG